MTNSRQLENILEQLTRIADTLEKLVIDETAKKVVVPKPDKKCGFDFVKAIKYQDFHSMEILRSCHVCKLEIPKDGKFRCPNL